MMVEFVGMSCRSVAISCGTCSSVGNGAGRRTSRCCADNGGRFTPIRMPTTSSSTPITTFFAIKDPPGARRARRSPAMIVRFVPMKRTWTIIGVRDVPGSVKWYQALFGQPQTPPSHDYFGQILDTDGTVLLCLHQWGAHDHPSLMNPDQAPPGNGLLLFFRVDDIDMALKRARKLVT